MGYLLSFLEGVVTFVSPCLLPMLPIYIAYFAGGESGAPASRRRAFVNAVGFVVGFTVVFLLLGAAAGSFGRLVRQHQAVFNAAGGAVLILFGLNLTGVVRIGFLNRTFRPGVTIRTFNFFTSLLLGIVFSVGWTPCVGVFLGSALMMAASSQRVGEGVLMLLLFSLGLGVPFMASALLIDRLGRAFGALKRHYRVVSAVSGLLLIGTGALMAAGKLGALLSVLTRR